MSKLLKSGFVPFGGNPNITKNEPFILDSNKLAAEKEKQNKIIYPVETSDKKTEETEKGTFSDGIIKPGEREELLNDAMDKAKELREDAINRANKIIEDATKKAETIRETAQAEGYEKGLEEGNMEAMKRADLFLEKLQDEQDKKLEEERKQLENQIVEAEKKLVDISSSLIAKLTGILVDDFKPVMLHMVNSAMAEAETSRKFVIRVSEYNYTYIADNKDRITGATNPNIDIEIFGDPKLDARQCVIETDNGIIDLSMDLQVKNLITAMKLLSE